MSLYQQTDQDGLERLILQMLTSGYEADFVTVEARVNSIHTTLSSGGSLAPSASPLCASRAVLSFYHHAIADCVSIAVAP